MRGATYIAFSFFLALFDQITKILVEAKICFGAQKYIFPFLSLVHVRNEGAAFGLLGSATPGIKALFLKLIPIFFTAFLFLILLNKKDKNKRIFYFSLSFILGGALGNMIDRIRFGEVVDFIDLHVGRWHWPAFNFADFFVTVGVALLIFSQIKSMK